MGGKDEVAKVIVAYYLELKPYLTSDRKWKEQFHRNMFDAIALGLTVLGKNWWGHRIGIILKIFPNIY